MKIANILLAASALSMASASSAHDNREDFDVMDALSICKDMFADFDAGKASLMEHGWTVPDREISEVYSGPSSTSLMRDKAVLFFIGKDAEIGKGEEGFKGACQVVLPGDSVLAATTLAKALNIAATSFVQSAPRSFNSVDFLNDDFLLEVASVNKANDMMRLQYAPK